jgi:two-component system, chemotaxis family, response regulator Rcp1
MKSQLRILLAEDNPGDVVLVKEALSSNNLSYSLRTAEDGERALEFIEEAEAGKLILDLVLLDLNLPKVSGDQVLARIRSSRKLKSLPVIIVTSSDSPRDRARTAALGVDYYFRKPSDFEEFLTLGNVVEQVCASA